VTHTVSNSTFAGGSSVEPLRSKSGWIVALGIVYLIAGIIALGSVALATVVSVLTVGIMMIIAGAAQVVNAFQVKSWGGFLLWLALGALYIIAGLVTFENPVLAATVLTLILGIALMISGIMRTILAFGMRQGLPWGWIAASGIITFLLGLVILAHWPFSGLYVLGLILGVDLVLAGLAWIGLGLGLSTSRSRLADGLRFHRP
jgi:uncharacterized membrane protein HdeD (DUF308 family)